MSNKSNCLVPVWIHKTVRQKVKIAAGIKGITMQKQIEELASKDFNNLVLDKEEENFYTNEKKISKSFRMGF